MKFIKNILRKHRYKKAANKWHNDRDYIVNSILESDEDRAFHWHLVWQEIVMYIQLDEKVDIDEFYWLCSRRGFSLEEKKYLQTMLEYVGLYK